MPNVVTTRNTKYLFTWVKLCKKEFSKFAPSHHVSQFYKLGFYQKVRFYTKNSLFATILLFTPTLPDV